MFSITQYTSRQREILEVVLRNGWDYMKGILTGTKNEAPQLPTPAVLRNILIELGPVYVKLGQLLSTRPDLLSPEYIEALSSLQSKVPPAGWSEVEKLLNQQLPQSLPEIFAEINTQAIAAGSIGQVYGATLKNGEKVAIKVQRPGIDVTVSQDIALIKALAELVTLTDFGKDYEIVELAKEFSNALQAELDFTAEARYTEQLQSNLAQSKWFDSEKLHLPKVHWDLTSSKILVLEWLEGVPLLEAKIPQDSTKRREIANLLFRAFFQQIYLDGFFHADPHPGNIFYLADERVALLDCGMVGRLDPRTQQLLTEMLLAVVDLDAKRCSQLTIELAESERPTNLEQLENDYNRMFRKYYNLTLADIKFSEVFYQILQLARKNKIKLPGNMGLYAKTLANLEGVARGFDPGFNILEEVKPLMSDVFSRQLLGKSPVETLFRTALDLKSLGLRSPRQIELLLDRVTSETFKLNISLQNLDALRRTLDDSANRLSFSIVVGSLIMGAAIISTGSRTEPMSLITELLFAAASFLGLWLLISIWRSGRLK